MNKNLDVYLHNHFAGQLTQNSSGELLFEYTEEYIASGGIGLSMSLPLQSIPFKGNAVKAFFSGILPDDIVRHRLAKYLGVSEKNPFALLEAIGGECAGAISLYPAGEKPNEETESDIKVLNDTELETILDLLKRRPMMAGDDGLRLSLAGAQDKIAVGVKNDQITIIEGTSPTTHILKPLIEDVKDSVHNEFFCMNLAKMMGITTPNTEIRWLKETPYFLIERYDRTVDDNNKIIRQHQEDFCQASNIPPEIKYEREGGPNIKSCLEIILNSCVNPAADQLKFLERVVFNFLIGNADAHGKNFSLLYRNKKPELSPTYDLLCTEIYKDLSSKMAMKIGGHYIPKNVMLRHWHKIVPETAAAKKNIDRLLQKMAVKCEKHAEKLINELQGKEITSEVFSEINDVIQNRAAQIETYFTK